MLPTPPPPRLISEPPSIPVRRRPPPPFHRCGHWSSRGSGALPSKSSADLVCLTAERFPSGLRPVSYASGEEVGRRPVRGAAPWLPGLTGGPLSSSQGPEGSLRATSTSRARGEGCFLHKHLWFRGLGFCFLPGLWEAWMAMLDPSWMPLSRARDPHARGAASVPRELAGSV